MSTFTHTLRVQAVLDDGTVYELSNVYDIEDVERVIQGYQNRGEITPPMEIPNFFIARSVEGVVQVNLENGSAILASELIPGNVWVVPDSTTMTSDSSATNVNVDDPVTGISFDNSAEASVVEYMGLITSAS